MKIVTNSKLIKRNSRIGQFTTIGALIILGVGLLITFKMPEKFVYSLVCLLAGFFLSQIGMYYGNRWGRSPRADEIINKNMKGLGREYTMYHFSTPASHLLVGPAGLWVILPFYQGGKIIYDGKRWRSKGGGFARSYMRLFGQENMGRPDQEAEAEIMAVKHHLEKNLPDGIPTPDIQAALLFTDPRVELQTAQSPIPAMVPEKLKDFLKSSAKARTVGEMTLSAIREVYPKNEKES